LEGNGAGVTDDAGTNLDQFELQAGQRPLGHFLGQLIGIAKSIWVNTDHDEQL
jgi:hypothetical protein